MSSPGAWVPWDAALAVMAQRLSPPSRWQVYLAVLLTSARYGGRDALLSVRDIASRTGLAERTVKAALRDLAAAGLVRRTARYRRLAVTLLRTPEVECEPRPPLP